MLPKCHILQLIDLSYYDKNPTTNLIFKEKVNITTMQLKF